MHRSTVTTLFAAATVLGAARAQSSSSGSGSIVLTNAGCADPSGYDSCAASVNSATTVCLNNAGESKEAILACGCASYTGTYNCYAESCWNKVCVRSKSQFCQFSMGWNRMVAESTWTLPLTINSGLGMRVPIIYRRVHGKLPDCQGTRPILPYPRQRPRRLRL